MLLLCRGEEARQRHADQFGAQQGEIPQGPLQTVVHGQGDAPHAEFFQLIGAGLHLVAQLDVTQPAFAFDQGDTVVLRELLPEMFNCRLHALPPRR
ncbi:hypothetical protein D9M68_739630 [compost metagenome]